MKFSIIVPIYNVEKYLDECIKSVLSQIHSDFELILVNDGSPDSCPKICDDYEKKDNRIIVIHKPNGGLVSARKAGLSVAKGEYILPLDGDDFLEYNCLSMIDDIINNYAPDVISFGAFRCKDSERKPKKLNRYRYGYYNRTQLENEIFPVLLSDNLGNRFPSNVWGKAIKRDLYTIYQNRVDSRISMGEDVACMYPLLANAQSLFISNECLYNYRVIQVSMSRTWRPLSWDNYDLVQNILETEFNRTDYDFNIQLARLRTHNLFNITYSQFKSNFSVLCTLKNISQRYNNNPEYYIMIENAYFKSYSYKIVRFILKHRLFYICYLYCLLVKHLKK